MLKTARCNFGLGGKGAAWPQGAAPRCMTKADGRALGWPPQTNMDKLQKAGPARLMQQGNDRKEQLWFTG
jgi:hypothetical protein